MSDPLWGPLATSSASYYGYGIFGLVTERREASGVPPKFPRYVYTEEIEPRTGDTVTTLLARSDLDWFDVVEQELLEKWGLNERS